MIGTPTNKVIYHDLSIFIVWDDLDSYWQLGWSQHWSLPYSLLYPLPDWTPEFSKLAWGAVTNHTFSTAARSSESTVQYTHEVLLLGWQWWHRTATVWRWWRANSKRAFIFDGQVDDILQPTGNGRIVTRTQTLSEWMKTLYAQKLNILGIDWFCQYGYAFHDLDHTLKLTNVLRAMKGRICQEARWLGTRRPICATLRFEGGWSMWISSFILRWWFFIWPFLLPCIIGHLWTSKKSQGGFFLQAGVDHCRCEVILWSINLFCKFYLNLRLFGAGHPLLLRGIPCCMWCVEACLMILFEDVWSTDIKSWLCPSRGLAYDQPHENMCSTLARRS